MIMFSWWPINTLHSYLSRETTTCIQQKVHYILQGLWWGDLTKLLLLTPGVKKWLGFFKDYFYVEAQSNNLIGTVSFVCVGFAYSVENSVHRLVYVFQVHIQNFIVCFMSYKEYLSAANQLYLSKLGSKPFGTPAFQLCYHFSWILLALSCPNQGLSLLYAISISYALESGRQLFLALTSPPRFRIHFLALVNLSICISLVCGTMCIHWS